MGPSLTTKLLSKIIELVERQPVEFVYFTSFSFLVFSLVADKIFPTNNLKPKYLSRVFLFIIFIIILNSTLVLKLVTCYTNYKTNSISLNMLYFCLCLFWEIVLTYYILTIKHKSKLILTLYSLFLITITTYILCLNITGYVFGFSFLFKIVSCLFFFLGLSIFFFCLIIVEFSNTSLNNLLYLSLIFILLCALLALVISLFLFWAKLKFCRAYQHSFD